MWPQAVTVKEKPKETPLYYAMIKAKGKNWSYELRWAIVSSAREKGIAPAAREFKTTRKTVRKWLDRYKGGGPNALLERSRRPLRSPLRIPKALENRIMLLRRKHPRWGALRLQDHYFLACSSATVARVFKRHGLVKPPVRKWRRQKDLRKLKAKLKPFEKVQVDVKHLDDIARYWRASSSGRLPRYEFTARDVKTGSVFIGLAWENTQEAAQEFIEKFLLHLKAYGVILKDVLIQTDHGAEFGMTNPYNWANPDTSAFVQTVKAQEALYLAIPIKRPTFNSDVETFHRLVEDEFYATEPINGLQELRHKAYTYNLYFNTLRKNRYRNNLTPKEILEAGQTKGIDTKGVYFWLPPLLGMHPKEREEKVRAQKEEREKKRRELQVRMDTIL